MIMISCLWERQGKTYQQLIIQVKYEKKFLRLFQFTHEHMQETETKFNSCLRNSLCCKCSRAIFKKKGYYGPLTKYSFILLCNICTKRATRNSCKVNCRLLESNLLRVRLLKCINHLFRYLHLEMFIKIFRDKI